MKVELQTYAQQTGQHVVKPFVLVIARDTTHAGELLKLIQSEKFFEGRYKEKVVQVDSSKTGAEEEEMIALHVLRRLARHRHRSFLAEATASGADVPLAEPAPFLHGMRSLQGGGLPFGQRFARFG